MKSLKLGNRARVGFLIAGATLAAASPSPATSASAAALDQGTGSARSAVERSASKPDSKGLVFLGDSAAAGVGAGSADTTRYATACDRTTSAYGYKVGVIRAVPVTVLACTGATSAGGLIGPQTAGLSDPNGRVPAQLDQLKALPHPAGVALTVGANDIHYSVFLSGCADPDPTHDCATTANTRKFHHLLYDVAEPNLRSVLVELIFKQRNHNVVLTGYYDPFGAAAASQFHLQPDEIVWYRARLGETNAMIQRESRQFHIKFVSLATLNVATGDVDVDPSTRGFLHPTDHGQAKIAGLVAARL
jgi:lysophospholipase L1-like esterase